MYLALGRYLILRDFNIFFRFAAIHSELLLVLLGVQLFILLSYQRVGSALGRCSDMFASIQVETAALLAADRVLLLKLAFIHEHFQQFKFRGRLLVLSLAHVVHRLVDYFFDRVLVYLFKMVGRILNFFGAFLQQVSQLVIGQTLRLFVTRECLLMRLHDRLRRELEPSEGLV